MFRKILIANRGEIAVRVIRACRDMGISPVAVYSAADRAALHVRLADEAYYIGEAPSAQSYLVKDRVLQAARESGAEAIHPGYGFLSENAEFARMTARAGITFIGPSAASIEMMGSKTNARDRALAAGAPIVPGTANTLTSLDEAIRTGDEVGWPVMLKAAAGGGGKGMRIVRTPAEMDAAFANATAEALAAFGDGAVYIEKYIEKPRHIEIQIAADQHGNCVHLGERECSIQRRHQKVIEECPSPLNDPGLRARMGEAAVKIARAAAYYSVGTIEFLVDVHRDFYFLEMNTRLQVEHPVTELVTGIDLVREQISIATGAPLSFRQEDVRWDGHAIECRVYAEDPEKNFMPSPGKITRLRVPAGPGVRDDGGVYEGWEVPIYYDPMISKLATYGASRAEAIARMRRALREYEVGGIRTTIPFFEAVLTDGEFIAGDLDTGFIGRFNERRAAAKTTETETMTETASGPDDAQLAAAITACLDYTRQAKQRAPAGHGTGPAVSRWKMSGRINAGGKR
ncbi:MAG: acetyl-CoA carboxylase biotin carboxylase subunit [Blastocatellia bacterium]